MSKTQTWYDFRATAANTAELSIYDSIGAWGVSAKTFIDDLRAHAGKNLTLRVNSPGGSTTEATAIFNALTRHTGTVTAHVDGLAASAATFIVCAASKVKMASNALFMIHNPAAGGGGGSVELRRLADVLDKIKATMVNTYAAKTGKPESVIREKMDAETWFTADEAKAFGFVDEVTGPQNTTAHFDLSAFAHPPGQAQRFGDFQAGDALTARITVFESKLAERDARIASFESALAADGGLFAFKDGKLSLTELGLARFVNAGITQTLAGFGHVALPLSSGGGEGFKAADTRTHRQKAVDETTESLVRRGLIADPKNNPWNNE